MPCRFIRPKYLIEIGVSPLQAAWALGIVSLVGIPGQIIFGHLLFSNRPFRVKHFQTFHRCSVDVSHGLALLFGIGTEALPSWSPRTRWNNLSGGLAVTRTAGSSDQAS